MTLKINNLDLNLFNDTQNITKDFLPFSPKET